MSADIPALHDLIEYLAELIAARVRADHDPPQANPLRLKDRRTPIGQVTIVPYRGDAPSKEEAG